MAKNALFIHAAILDKCKERLLQYLDAICNSKLIDNLEYIFICFVGEPPNSIKLDDIDKYNCRQNIRILNVSNDVQSYEIPTLDYLYNFCKEHPDYNISYLHTKNVGKELNQCIEDQIEYMLHFNVANWEKCVNKLTEYQTCGVDLLDTPTLHYSGNFWWAKAAHVNSLPSPTYFNDLERYPNPLNSLRHNQEFWICSDKNTNNHYSLWNCGINCYERHLHRYPKEKYILFNTLANITFNKIGCEIGGPSSATGEVLYQNATIVDNVIFSTNTIWSSHTDEYNYYGNKTGKVIIDDAVNISHVGNECYDFLFSSHSLEHIANPLKAINEWLRIIKNGGYIIIIVPEKSVCFDHKRNYSRFSTLLSQYEKNVGEDDLSTLTEILQNHDLSMDTAAGDLTNFTKRSLDNFNNRCLHHYTYNDELLMEICNYFKCEFVYKETQGINRWFIIKKSN